MKPQATSSGLGGLEAGWRGGILGVDVGVAV